ncbi:MAG: hypothetical protein HY082_10750 [Gammaproteobacteria bacterium]|nr:hypothetical protein [Gammaproteobacteria bacterium]
MQDIMMRLVDVPLARMFVLASIIFLLLAVLGKIEGKIEPGKIGRIGATIVGAILLSAGLAMHFNDADALRDKLRESISPPQAAAVRVSGDTSESAMARLAMTSQSRAGSMDKTGASGKTENLRPMIRVISGTYGNNCGAKPGNATAQMSRACDGQTLCEYKIDPAALENPAPNCAKNFMVEWKCGAAETVYAVSVPAGVVRDEPLRLACSVQ